jgi:hypothetical protein
MKNLFITIISFCLAALFSISAGAAGSDMQIQQRAPAPVQQPAQPRHVQRILYYQTPSQWVTHVTQQTNVPYSQTTQQGTASGGSAQDLKSFSQQTQQQMADFSKL